MVGICRLCATLRKMELLTSITDNSPELCEKVQETCQVHIRMDDSLPKSVCAECIQALGVAHSFCKKVREAQEALEALFPSGQQRSKKSSELAETLTTAGIVVELRAQTRDVVGTIGELPETHIDDLKCEKHYEQNKAGESTEICTEDTSQKDDSFIGVYHMLQDGDEQNDKTVVQEAESTITSEFVLIKEYVKRSQSDDQAADSSNQSAVSMFREPIENPEAKTNVDDEHEMEVMMAYESDAEDMPVEEHLIENDSRDMDDEDQLADCDSKTLVTNWSSYEWHCYLCSYTATSHKSLQAHFLRTHGVKLTDLQYKCRDCHKICARYHTFLNHVRLRHHLELALRCDACNERFDNYAQLDEHRCACTNVDEFPKVVFCTSCGKGFLNKSAVQIHMRAQHTQIDKFHICKECGKQFKRLSALRAHQLIHSDLKDFTCELCGHAFRQKVNLDVHLSSHMNEKPFKCVTCQKNFKTSISLEKHTQLHTDVKHFKCDYCESFFRTKDAKLSHERIHTGELPFECEYCGKRFRFRSTMLTHRNVHTGNRPYSCEACSHSFTNWSNYNKHMKRRHSTPDTKHTKDTKAKSRSRTAGGTSMKSKKTATPPYTDRVHVVSYVYDENAEEVHETNTNRKLVEMLTRPTDSELTVPELGERFL